VEHSEEIKKSLSITERGGSIGWKGRDEAKTKEVQEALEEDFKDLFEQTEYMWQTRRKMASILQRRSQTRWTTLTNAFTYMCAKFTPLGEFITDSLALRLLPSYLEYTG